MYYSAKKTRGKLFMKRCQVLLEETLLVVLVGILLGSLAACIYLVLFDQEQLIERILQTASWLEGVIK